MATIVNLFPDERFSSLGAGLAQGAKDLAEASKRSKLKSEIETAQGKIQSSTSREEAEGILSTLSVEARQIANDMLRQDIKSKFPGVPFAVTDFTDPDNPGFFTFETADKARERQELLASLGRTKTEVISPDFFEEAERNFSRQTALIENRRAIAEEKRRVAQEERDVAEEQRRVAQEEDREAALAERAFGTIDRSGEVPVVRTFSDEEDAIEDAQRDGVEFVSQGALEAAFDEVGAAQDLFDTKQTSITSRLTETEKDIQARLTQLPTEDALFATPTTVRNLKNLEPQVISHMSSIFGGSKDAAGQDIGTRNSSALAFDAGVAVGQSVLARGGDVQRAKKLGFFAGMLTTKESDLKIQMQFGPIPVSEAFASEVGTPLSFFRDNFMSNPEHLKNIPPYNPKDPNTVFKLEDEETGDILPVVKIQGKLYPFARRIVKSGI